MRQLTENADAVDEYVTERFAVDADDGRCLLERGDSPDLRQRNDRAFAVLGYVAECGGRELGTIAVSSALFPDLEGFVHDTETLVSWDLDGARGSGVLDAATPTIELDATAPQFGAFFLLGAEHLLLGLDHVLFLLALLLGARSITRGAASTRR